MSVPLREPRAELPDPKQPKPVTTGTAGSLLREALALMGRLGMQGRPLGPRDALGPCNQETRRGARALAWRLGQLPDPEQESPPILLDALGKFQAVTGDFRGAEDSFTRETRVVTHPPLRAAALFSNHRAALESRRWAEALSPLVEAAALDPGRFSPFPLSRYEPQRILGAGGASTTFLCRDTQTNQMVVVKSLQADELERAATEIFPESRVLQQLGHPVLQGACGGGFGAPATRTRPYLVLDHFPGGTLKQFVEQRGTLTLDQTLAVVVQVAQGMLAAHGKGVLHRDLRPANVLVRKEGNQWRVKVIDFGLSLRNEIIEEALARSEVVGLLGASAADATLYAAPEQRGRVPGERSGETSDVYSFGKLCFFMLFGTTEPAAEQSSPLPQELAELLAWCTRKEPGQRPGFKPVLDILEGLLAQGPQPVPGPTFRQEEPPAPPPEPEPEPVAEVEEIPPTIADTIPLPPLPGSDQVVSDGEPSVRESAPEGEPELPTEAGSAPATVVGETVRERAPAEREEREPAPESLVDEIGDTVPPVAEAPFLPKDEPESELEAPLQDIRDTAPLPETEGEPAPPVANEEPPCEEPLQDLRDTAPLPSPQPEPESSPVAAPEPERVPTAEQYQQQAEAHLRNRNPDLALADATEAIRLDPSHAPAHATRAAAYRQLGEGDQAVADATQALRLDPTYVPALVIRATAYRMKGDLDRAIADATEAIRLNPQSAPAYFNRAEARRMKGDFGQAIADATEAIRLDPSYAPAYGTRAESQRALGKLDGAIVDATEAIRLAPRAAPAFATRAESYRLRGEFERAVADATEAITFNPRFVPALFCRAAAYLGLGEYARTVADSSEALRLAPGAVPAYGTRAAGYLGLGEYDRAIADADQALQLDPGFAPAYGTRAEAYRLKGDGNRAIADATEALRLDPASALAHLTRAEGYRMKGDFLSALADMNEALRLDPSLGQGRRW
jgi:tetratricopeptide (TPR) repeat protein/serine/threonine protein kinase